ncbi:MAG: hypothetical protein IIW93_05775, partial [Bacteroidaceae bacterium]|nr:hypothetical protein [Bacteroidaceae bacterium]
QIRDGVNGWLVEPNDVAGLRAKIIDIINNKERISIMSANSSLPHPLASYSESLQVIYSNLSQK